MYPDSWWSSAQTDDPCPALRLTFAGRLLPWATPPIDYEGSPRHEDREARGRRTTTSTTITARAVGNRLCKAALLALLFASLGACASARLDTQAAVADLDNKLPTSWTAAAADSGASVSTYLLDLVDDDRLRELVAEAVQANPDLRAAGLRLAASRRLLKETESLGRPLAEAGLETDRTSQALDASDEPGPATRHRISVSVSWEIDLWSRLADLAGESSSLVRSEAYELEAARDALGARVIHAWIEAVTLSQTTALEQQRIEVLEKLQGTITRRYRRGLGSLEDLAGARASEQLARAAAAGLSAELEQTVRDLELLLGRMPRAELLTAGSLPTVRKADPGHPVAVVARRPDVRAALMRLEAADAAAAAAAKALLPAVRLSGELAKDKASLAGLLSSESIWTVVGSITQPLLQRDVLRARSEARTLELEAAWEGYRSAVLRAVREIGESLALEHRLLRQHEHLVAALDESKRSARTSEGRYRGGLADISELLQARDQEMSIRRQVITIKGEVLQNRIALALAVGAGLREKRS